MCTYFSKMNYMFTVIHKYNMHPFGVYSYFLACVIVS
jgi:hypothetical protein